MRACHHRPPRRSPLLAAAVCLAVIGGGGRSCAQETAAEPAVNADRQPERDIRPGAAAPVRESAPQLFYLQDDAGRLVPVPGFRYRDFVELFRLREGLPVVPQPAPAVLEEVDVRIGRLAADGTAPVTVAAVVRQIRDGWVSVPLELGGLILAAPPRHDGPGRVVLAADPRRAGLCAWFEATAEGGAVIRHELTLEGRLPVDAAARIAELSRFRSDFAFRRGLVGSLIGIQRPEAVAALIRLLASLKGEARMDVVRYLTAVSGQRHGADVEAWNRWWREAGETFEFLDRPVLPAHAEVAAGDTGSYYDIPLYAQSLVFVIDTSLSMEGPRLAAAQRELIEAIEGLPPTTRFNVIGFGSRAYAWQPRLVAAEPAAKEAAGSFVGQLVADGQTATFDAIETAFQFDVEAVFLLSDGEPTAGKVVDPAAIARFVGAANQARRMSVYTIGVLPEPELAAFLRGLAEQNFGCYLQVDQ